jgi:hypothetical protein
MAIAKWVVSGLYLLNLKKIFVWLRVAFVRHALGVPSCYKTDSTHSPWSPAYLLFVITIMLICTYYYSFYTDEVARVETTTRQQEGVNSLRLSAVKTTIGSIPGKTTTALYSQK